MRCLLMITTIFVTLNGSHGLAFAADEIDGIAVPDITAVEIGVETESNHSSNSFQWPRFTTAYQIGSSVKRDPEVVSNRFDLRLQWSELFPGGIFSQIDSKVIVRSLGDDARAPDTKTDTQLRVRELFVQGGTETLSVKLGIQPVVWSELDTSSVLDVLTPFDYTEFAFTSPDEARVGQTWIAIDGYVAGKWSFIYSPLPQTTRYPQGNVDKLLSTVLGTDQFSTNLFEPKTFKDQEWAMRWKTNLVGSDLSVVYADVISDDPIFENRSNQNGLVFDIRYPRYRLFGASANIAYGNFLLKGEAAYKANAYVLGSASVTNIVDIAGGFEYNASGAYTLQLESANHYIVEPTMRAPGGHRNLTQIAGRWSKNFLNDTLSAIYYASYQLQYNDVIHSAGLHYSWSDRLMFDLNLTLFVIENADSPMRFADDWDQLLIKISYSI